LSRQLLDALDQRGLAGAGGALYQAGHRVPLRLAGILKPAFIDAVGSAKNVGYRLVPPDEDRGRASRAILAETNQLRALLVVSHCHAPVDPIRPTLFELSVHYTLRAYRIGQIRPVTIYRLVAEGAIKDQIVELHRHKKDLADRLLQDAGAPARLNAEELLELLRQPMR